MPTYIDALLASQWFWLVLTLVLTAMSHRLDAAGANWLLVAAWITAAIGIFRALPESQPVIPRVLLVLLINSALGLTLYRTLWTATASPMATDARMPVRLEWHREGTQLNVALINLGTETVRDYISLSVIDIRKRSNTGTFVEVPAFHADGPFTETSLTLIGNAFEDMPLLPNVPRIALFLRLDNGTHIFDAGTNRLLFFRIGPDDDVLRLIYIPEPGIWRATVKVVKGNVKLNSDPTELFFEWAGTGHPATPWAGS